MNRGASGLEGVCQLNRERSTTGRVRAGRSADHGDVEFVLDLLLQKTEVMRTPFPHPEIAIGTPI